MDNSKQLSILTRLGESRLMDFIGPDVLDVISQLDKKPIGPRAIAELLLQLEGPFLILQNKDVRRAVFDALSPRAATELAEYLGYPASDPYSALEKVSFRKNSKAYLKLASWFAIDLDQTLEDREPGDVVEKITDCAPAYPLFNHQIDAVRRATSALNEGAGRVILHMPTGSGKTRSAMNLVADQFRNFNADGECIVWLAHSEELCDQAADEFAKAWSALGNRKIKIIRHYGKYSSEMISDYQNSFIVLGLQSANAMAGSDVHDARLLSIGRKTSLVVIDEAHKATASTYSHVMELLAPRGTSKILGLTATPGRSWLDVGADEELADFFDRKKVTLDIPGYSNPVDYLVAEEYLAKVTVEEINYDGGAELNASEQATLSATGELSANMLKSVSEDVARNLRIVLRTEKEAASNNSVILFACSVQHAKSLTAMLVMRGVSAACVTGDTDRVVRQKAISDFKEGKVSVLCNYGVLSTGFDAPKANVALIARPTKSIVLYSQMVGRVIRGAQAGGTEECTVITVVDQKYGFRNLGESFTFWDDLWTEQ